MHSRFQPDVAPDLLRACAEAPSEAVEWEAFLLAGAPRIRAAIRNSLLAAGAFPARDLAEDLEQEVFCRLLERDRRALTSFRGASEGEAGQYLRRIAATVVADALRAAAAHKRRPPLDPTSLADLHDGSAGLADRRACPEARLLARERAQGFLRRCRQILGRRATPERCRVIRLAWMRGLSSADVAEKMGGRWTRSAVDCLLHRLRRRLVAAGEACPVRPGARRG